jgi:hypothetical protein
MPVTSNLTFQSFQTPSHAWGLSQISQFVISAQVSPRTQLVIVDIGLVRVIVDIGLVRVIGDIGLVRVIVDIGLIRVIVDIGLVRIIGIYCHFQQLFSYDYQTNCVRGVTWADITN